MSEQPYFSDEYYENARAQLKEGALVAARRDNPSIVSKISQKKINNYPSISEMIKGTVFVTKRIFEQLKLTLE